MASFGFAAFEGGVSWIGKPRETKAGKTVVNFSVAIEKDRFNEETKQYDRGADGKYYESVTAFGRVADNFLSSVHLGDRVVVIGDRDPKPDYTDSAGVEHKNENQITARSVGAAMSIWPVTVNKNTYSKAESSGPSSDEEPHRAPTKSKPTTAKRPQRTDIINEEDDEW